MVTKKKKKPAPKKSKALAKKVAPKPKKLAPKKAAPSKKKKEAPKRAAPEKKAVPKKKSADRLQSACSGGGPVIGIPAEIAAKWRGTLPPIGAVVPPNWEWGSPGGPVCDYDRACDKIENHVSMPYGGFGSVPVDGGLALIFEAEIVTYWVPTADGGVVVRQAELESVAEALQLIAAVPAAKWKRWPGQITLRDGRIFFFDSAMEGADDPSAIRRSGGQAIGTPGPGTYAISTAVDDAENEYVKLTRV